jgi:hypothetical protein
VTLYFRSDEHFDFNQLLQSNNPDTAVVIELSPESVDSTELEED